MQFSFCQKSQGFQFFGTLFYLHKVIGFEGKALISLLSLMPLHCASQNKEPSPPRSLRTAVFPEGGKLMSEWGGEKKGKTSAERPWQVWPANRRATSRA